MHEPHQRVGFELVVPRVQGRHARGLADAVPVLADPVADDVLALGRSEPPFATEDFEAGRQPLDIPLPRSWERLVEVVDIEEHAPLGRAEQPEVGQVSVSAQLDRHPRHGGD